MTKLINDVFDILNGRFSAQGINLRNWHIKEKKLRIMLDILKQSEDCFKKNPKIPMFMSQTTLLGWRVTISSVILLTEEMFSAGFHTVLTGRFNQDPIEVISYFKISNYCFMLIV